MLSLFNSLFASIAGLGAIGYLILFAVTVGESFVITGLFVPGTIVLLIMGGLAPYGSYSMFYLAAVGFAGAIIGNALSYELGLLGTMHVQKIPVIGKHYERARAFFVAHGGKSILLCRFVGPMRPLVPFIAGATRMKRSAFYYYTVFGGFIWITAYLCFGYAFGYAWQRAAAWSSTIVIVIFIVLAIFFGITRLLRMRR